MAPRSEYILPQGFKSNRNNPGDKVINDNVVFTNEDNDFSTISIFKKSLCTDNLLIIDDELQIDNKDPNQIIMKRWSYQNPKVKRSLIPELELEAARLAPTGPWFTLPRSQYKRSKSMRKVLNDPVKQKLFTE